MPKGQGAGISGTTKIVFAIPTDDAHVWRLKNGTISFERGFTARIEVEGGYIPHARGRDGLTVTYCVFRSAENHGPRVTGDVAMTTCVNGRVMDSVDIAQGVEVILPPDVAEASSAAATPGG